MSFTDHKITQFEHRIADLADQPNLPPDELKARFDSSPEELRQAVNAICDESDALSARIDRHDTQINQIATDKFPDDTIQDKNLHPDLAAKLNGKANQTALAAEAAAREEADDALGTLLTTNETLTAQKCEVYVGTYTGNGQNTRTVSLGLRPKAVILCNIYGMFYVSGMTHGGIIWDNMDNSAAGCIVDDGFQVYKRVASDATNENGEVYFYIALV